MCSIVKSAGAAILEFPIAFVHKERRTHDTRKIRANQPVNFFNISAVDVPNNDSLASPPKEAPSPELLLSCIKMTEQRRKQRKRNNAIEKKYRNVIKPNLLIEFLNNYH